MPVLSVRPQLFVHIHNKLETGPLKVFQTEIYTWFNIGCFSIGQMRAGKLLPGGHSRKSL